MNWEDILQDFDVVITKSMGVEIKYLYIKGLLYNIQDGYRWRYLNDIKEGREDIMSIYRLIINVKTIALRGNIGLMEQIYPAAEEEERNCVVEIAFVGRKATEKAWCHKDLVRRLDNKYVLIESRRGDRGIAKAISIYDTTNLRKEYEYEIIKGIKNIEYKPMKDCQS